MKHKLLAVALAMLMIGGVTAQVAGVQPVAQVETGNQSPGAGNQPAPESGLTVTDITAVDSATPGDNVTVVGTIANPTDNRTTEFVEVRFDGDVVDRTAVTLEPNESTTVTTSIATTDIEPGEHVHGFFTETDGQLRSLVLSESFTVDRLDVPPVGESLDVSANVTNPNDFETTQSVTYRFGGTPLSTKSVTLGPGETRTVEFSVPLPDVGAGDYFHGIYTRDSGAVDSLSLAEAGNEVNVTFNDQSGNGTNVTVEDVRLPADGYVAIHDTTLLEGEAVGSVVGVSEYQEAGEYENLSVTLFDVPGAEFNETELTENATLIAMPHEESANNTEYDFVRTNGTQDGAFTVDEAPVTDDGFVTVETTDPPDEGNVTDDDEGDS